MVPGRVAIVVLNWNAMPFLDRCLRSIVRHTRADYELVIVDNGSADGSKDLVRDFIRSHPALRVEFLNLVDNLYFSKGFNLGFQAASLEAEYLMMVCNDVEVKEDGWLGHLMAAAGDPRVIAAGHAEPHSRLSPEQREIFRRSDPCYGDTELRRRMNELVHDPSFTYTHLYGYCFLLRRSHLEQTGLYLEHGDFRQYHSDWEWYVRFKALGFEVAPVLPKVHHWHGISELIALHPKLYRDLLARIADPRVAERYLREGRPLYEQESGYRELQRQERRKGRVRDGG
jgi:GT2 family glycosyltransferase